MNPWDLYDSRRMVHGNTKRQTTYRRAYGRLTDKVVDSLSFHTAVVDGTERQLSIINSDNLNEKKILTMPGEDIDCGGIVEWMDNHWLITEKDANNELYARAKMEQCNYLLKWVDPDSKQIIERWCIIEDGTKYLTGEYGDRQFVFLRGDSRISITIARDEYTVKLDRESRFLVDDYESGTVLAYRLTKPFKLSGVFNNKGIYRFVLSECTTEDTDNIPLHIPDYYKYFPRPEDPVPVPPGIPTTPTGKKVWL